MLILLIHESVKISNLFIHQQVMLSLEILRSFPILEFVIWFLRGPKYRSPFHIDFNRFREEIASALYVLVIDGVNERMLSVML